MQEMPKIKTAERKDEDINESVNKRIEGILGERIEGVDLKILPSERQMVFIRFVECLEKLLKTGGANKKDEEFVRDVFEVLGRILPEDKREVEIPVFREELKVALYDFYLLLLTSLFDGNLPRDESGSKIRDKIGKIRISDFRRVMKIWEDYKDGIWLFYGLTDDEREIMKREMEEAFEGFRRKSVVGTKPSGEFGCFLRQDPEFWKSLFASIIEEREAEFMEGLTRFVLRARELLERLTKINFPPELEEVIFEEDEREREKKLEKLSQEDRKLAENVISIQNGIINTLNEIKTVKEKKEISPDEWHILLTRKLEALEEKIKSYENSIKELEEKFGTKALEKKEEEKRKDAIFGGIGQWIQENFSDVAPLFGYFGLVALLFLPIKLLRSMQETFEGDPIVKKVKQFLNWPKFEI